jgi:hypothetical protein
MNRSIDQSIDRSIDPGKYGGAPPKSDCIDSRRHHLPLWQGQKTPKEQTEDEVQMVNLMMMMMMVKMMTEEDLKEWWW